MGEEGSSPSTCWREVYAAMGVEDDQHEADEGERDRCPDCGLVVAREEEHRCSLAATEQPDEDIETLPAPDETEDD